MSDSLEKKVSPTTDNAAAEAALQKANPELRARLREAVQPEVIQLDELSLLEVELLSSKMKAQELEERLALIALRDAREKKSLLMEEEGKLLQKVAEKFNLEGISSFKLMDRQKRLCAVTRKAP